MIGFSSIPWLAAAGAAAVAGGLYLYNGILSDRLDLANQKLAAAEATIEQERAARKAAIAEAERAREAAKRFNGIRGTARKAPDANDPASPVVLDTLRRLRGDGDGLPPGGD